MPIAHHGREDGVLVTVATGQLSEQDLLAHLRDHCEDPDLRPGMRELLDLRGISAVDLPTEALRRVIAYEKEHLDVFRGARLAIVAEADLHYGLSRMYEMMSDDGEADVSVHRSVERAEAWLRVEDE